MDDWVKQSIKALKPRVADPARMDPQAVYLAHNELPYPPSPQVIQAIIDAVPRLNRYPDTLGGSLRPIVADYAGVTESEIVIGNGSDDLIELITKVFVASEEQVLIPNPTFSIYALATEVVGGNPVFVERTSTFDLKIEEMIEQAAQAKIVFVANPNNPTANLTQRRDLITLLENVKGLVVVDECYYEFSRQTIANLINTYENLLVLRSLSKSFGLAGLRIGYAIANQKIADYLYRASQIFPVNTLALVAGVAALKDWSYTDSKIRQVCTERDHLQDKMVEMGFRVYPSATNYLFVNTKPLGMTSATLVQKLRQRQIWVRDFGGQMGLEDYYFRMAVGTPDENLRVQEALVKILS